MYNFIDMEKKYAANNYDPIKVVLDKAKGVWMWDTEGKRYLDMMSAYSAVSFGHCNEEILEVLHNQSKKLNVASRAYYNNVLPDFMKKLTEMTGLDRVIPMSTGAEGVETAIKASRLWGYKEKGIELDKAEIIVARNNFHGRTTTVISFSTEDDYRKYFGPHTPGFVHVDYDSIESLENAITKNTCAFIIEPVQGEAGILVPSKGYLKKAQEVCKKHNVMFIVDEVQAGMGRTGKNFAFQHEIDKPDGLILGKALGGGVLPRINPSG